MLSAKCVRIHGMKDENWTIKDKLNQYRGILKLNAREKKVRISDAAKTKKKVSKDLKSLKEDVKEYRGIVNNVISGDKMRMHTVLQNHKDFQLIYENRNPDVVQDGVFEDCAFKRKQLDKIFYEKKKKMKQFFDLKLECAILADKYEREQECLPNYVQQRLITRYQQSMAKQNAAKSIRTTYHAMLNILEKDAIYFDSVLDSLKDDQKGQCKVILKATVMGQLAAENLDDTRTRYKLMASEVWINMKERERTLNIVRGQVKDLWAYAQSLVRVESDANFATGAKKETETEDTLERQIKHLEDTFDRVKDSLSVLSYEELFSRLEEQIKQKALLQEQFNKNFTERDKLLNEKNHALLVKATLENSMMTTTGKYKAEKKAMLEEIEVQKKREIEKNNLRMSRGEVLIKVKAALENMLAMLMYVKEPVTIKGSKKVAKEAIDKRVAKDNIRELREERNEKLESHENSEETQLVFKVETDALALLGQVSVKANTLFAMSNFELDPEKEEAARDMYQTYIADYRWRLKYGNGEPEPTGIFVEHEVVDSSVLSRADVKLRSRQIVESNLKPE